MTTKPPGAGRSSFELIDHDRLFRRLALREGLTFLDVASGRGAYSLAAAEIVGPAGKIMAVDLWREGIEGLRRQAREKGLDNIRAEVSDLREQIPFPDDSADVALMATTLHDFAHDDRRDTVLREVARVLKPGGRLAVVDFFEHLDGPPGPPPHIRISAQQAQELLAPYGFVHELTEEIGPYNYLALFTFEA